MGKLPGPETAPVFGPHVEQLACERLSGDNKREAEAGDAQFLILAFEMAGRCVHISTVKKEDG